MWETEERVFVTVSQIPIKRCEIRDRRRVSPQLKNGIKLDLLLMKPLNPPPLSQCLCVSVCLIWYYSAIVGSVTLSLAKKLCS